MPFHSIDQFQHSSRFIANLIQAMLLLQQSFGASKLIYLVAFTGIAFLVYSLSRQKPVPKGLRKVPGPKGLPLGMLCD